MLLYLRFWKTTQWLCPLQDSPHHSRVFTRNQQLGAWVLVSEIMLVLLFCLQVRLMSCGRCPRRETLFSASLATTIQLEVFLLNSPLQSSLEEEDSGVLYLTHSPACITTTLTSQSKSPTQSFLHLSERQMLRGKWWRGGEQSSWRQQYLFLQDLSYHLLLLKQLATSHHSPSQPFLFAANGPGEHRQPKPSPFSLPPEASPSRGSRSIFVRCMHQVFSQGSVTLKVKDHCLAACSAFESGKQPSKGRREIRISQEPKQGVWKCCQNVFGSKLLLA